MREFIPVILVIAALGCSTALPPQEPVPVAPLQFSSGEGLAVQNVFILTDGSGTMWVNRTFPTAKAQTQSFVAAMPDGNYQAASIGFGVFSLLA